MTALPNLQVLDLACSYYKSAEVLTDADANAIVIINLRCHAIELFLKSLHLKDTATDIGDGVLLLQPDSGRDVNHNLQDSFDKALKEHRDELLSDMPTLPVDLANLEGIFAKSRYFFETSDSLPFSTAERVSRFLAKKIAKLPRPPVSIY